MMLYLMVYFFSVGLVVFGAILFLFAIRIPGVRALLGAMVSMVPVVIGILLFVFSGLKPSQLGYLLQTTSDQMAEWGHTVKHQQALQQELYQNYR